MALGTPPFDLVCVCFVCVYGWVFIYYIFVRACVRVHTTTHNSSSSTAAIFLVNVHGHSFVFRCDFAAPKVGCNRISSNVVKTLLVDEIVWYRNVIRALQEQNKGEDMSEDQVLRAVRNDFKNVRHNERLY